MSKTIHEQDSSFELITFSANAVIFDEGERADSAYIIRAGDIEIRKSRMSSFPVTLAKLERGDTFGEMALFDGRPRMASAIALTNVSIIKMPRDVFYDKLDVMDPVMKTMVIKIVSRLRDMSDEFMYKKVN